MEIYVIRVFWCFFKKSNEIFFHMFRHVVFCYKEREDCEEPRNTLTWRRK